MVADGPSTTTDGCIALLETLGGYGSNHDRVYIVDPAVSIYSRKAMGDIVVPGSAVAIGTLAAVKQWESPGNQSVPINGTTRTFYDIDVKNQKCAIGGVDQLAVHRAFVELF